MNNKCGYCGLIHDTVCNMIKAIEYYPDGTVKKVEFKGAMDYPPPVNIPTFVVPQQQTPTRTGEW